MNSLFLILTITLTEVYDCHITICTTHQTSIPPNWGELAVRSVWEGEMRRKGGEVDWKQRRDDQKQRPDRKRYETDRVMMQTFGNS